MIGCPSAPMSRERCRKNRVTSRSARVKAGHRKREAVAV
jgi:hypothetical protein